MPDPAAVARAQELRRLHQDPAILVLVNVWDAASARTVASVPGCRAIATASWAIAAAHGLADGEAIGREGMLEAIACVASAVELPVTADLEGGYGDAPETIRRAIGLGVVGANIEDQLKPIAEATKQVENIMRVAEQEGVDFVLNARTDAFARGRDRDPAENLADAIERGQAYLGAGAPVVFVPARLTEDQILDLVDAYGRQRRTTIGIPGNPARDWQQEHAVARTSYGPLSLNVALTALQELAEEVHRGGGVPGNMRLLT